MSQRSRRPVIPLAPGLELADTKPRLLAMVFDLTIIVLIMFVTVNVGAGWYARHYRPAERTAIDRAQQARTDASKQLTKAQDRRGAAEKALAAAKGADRDAARAKLDAAIEAARDLARANPGTGSYEIRPVAQFNASRLPAEPAPVARKPAA